MSPSAKAGESPAEAQLSVLVVEDDKFLHKILLTKFQKEGFVVHGALDGESALAELAGFRPSVILLDIILPKMNGFEFLSKIKTDPKYADVPVVVLSNLSQEEDIRRARDLGAEDFLVKADLSINDVVTRVRETYAKHLAKQLRRA